MIFIKDTPLSLAGPNQSGWYVITSDSWADLHSFYTTWHGKLYGLTEEEKIELSSTPTRFQGGMFSSKAIQLRLNVPERGLNMHRSKTPIRILTPEKNIEWLNELEKAFIPDKYVPILNMMLRKQYSAYSGRGLTAEMERFFDNEIRGKLIDLLRSGQWVDHPEHSDLEFLNQQLEKIDLGRRSDLKFSSSQSERSSEISEKFVPGAGKEVLGSHLEQLKRASGEKKPEIPSAEGEELTVGASGRTFRDFMATS